MLTQAILKENLHYSIITGQFYWLKPAGCRAKVGSIAGTLNSRGYMRIGIIGKKYSAHRLAWFWVTGEWPANEIDHTNGEKDANYWLNLREATHSQNQQNKGISSNNTSGYKGVYWSKASQKWRAHIRLNNGYKNLGLFESVEAAYTVRIKAEKELHGDFVRTL